MVITKMLSNNKGVSLVILIVAMTLIAILGASFVSFMGVKQRGFLHQLDSYRALNIANAGVEYAIRYISDGLSDTTDPNNNFFSDPTATVNRSFAGGVFAFTYYHDYDTNGNINDSTLLVRAGYPQTNPLSKREIKLSNFRRYLNPITLVPSTPSLPSIPPSISGNDIVIRVISNNGSSFTVSRVDVTMPATGSDSFVTVFRDGSSVFENSSSSPYAECGAIPSAVCRSTNGIYIEGDGSTNPVRFELTSPNHDPDGIYTYRLRFYPPVASAPSGQYIMRLYTSLPSGNPFTITFSVP